MSDNHTPRPTYVNPRFTLPIDGTVYATDVQPEDGLAYVTIAGPDEDKPMIVMFDLEDLDALKNARRELRREIAKLRPRQVRKAVTG